MDNAATESFFSNLKTKALYPYEIRGVVEAQRRMEDYICFYNEERTINKLTRV
ncbi:IS3 family transposase [Brevibacillus sp. NRS-1366]|uniref:IS3 family transposase n=1 Tax=Brevibacillus sp. NRS-1366 TaxID=3233899 RepID=UPI003D252023